MEGLEGQTKIKEEEVVIADQTPREEESIQFMGDQLQPGEQQEWPPRLYALSSDGSAVRLGGSEGTREEEDFTGAGHNELGRYAPLGYDDGTSCFPAQAFAWANAEQRTSSSSRPGLLPLPLPPPADHQSTPNHFQNSQPSSSSYYPQNNAQNFDGNQPNTNHPSFPLPPPSRLSDPPLDQHDASASYTTYGSGLVARPATSPNEALASSIAGLRELGMDEGGAPYVEVVGSSLDEITRRSDAEKLDTAMSSRLPLVASSSRQLSLLSLPPPSPSTSTYRDTPPHSAPHYQHSQRIPSFYQPQSHSRRQSDTSDYRPSLSSLSPYQQQQQPHQPYNVLSQYGSTSDHQAKRPNSYYNPSSSNGTPSLFLPPPLPPPVLPHSSSSQRPPALAPLIFPHPNSTYSGSSTSTSTSNSNSSSYPLVSSTTSPSNQSTNSSLPRVAASNSPTSTVSSTHSSNLYPPASSNHNNAKVKPAPKRTPIACQRCRAHKLRCLGGQPCSGCAKKSVGDSCTYVAEIKRRGKGKVRGAAPVPSPSTTSNSPNKGGVTMLENGNGDDKDGSTASRRKESSRSPAKSEGRRGGKGRKLDDDEKEEEHGEDERGRPRLTAAEMEEDVDMEEEKEERGLENAEEEEGQPRREMDGGEASSRWMTTTQ